MDLSENSLDQEGSSPHKDGQDLCNSELRGHWVESY